jgi:hypothetical protein
MYDHYGGIRQSFLKSACFDVIQSGEQRDEVNKMKMGALENFLLTKTSTGCVLGKCPTNGVRVCDIALVMHELHARNMEIIGDESENVLRNKLERQLQLEDEHLGLA